MHNFKELKVWQKAMDLTLLVYKVTNEFPVQEKFGLISQINRSVISIPSNIAEGSGRKSKKEFASFLSIALGSAFELETQIILANKLSFLKERNYEVLSSSLTEVQKMIVGLKKTLITELAN